MNCFYHPEKVAVGLCKSCGRGLCMECAADIHDGLACKGRCEERAIRINKIIDRNERVIVATNTQLRRGMIFSVIVGLLFVAFGVLSISGEKTASGIFFTAIGVVFVIRGIASYSRAARYPTLEKDAK